MSHLVPSANSPSKYHHLDISTSGQVKEKTEKSTRQRPRGTKVEGKPSTINSIEDRTEVLQEEEATSIKLTPPGGTEISLHTINSTHYNQDKANHIHETSNDTLSDTSANLITKFEFSTNLTHRYEEFLN